MISTTRPYNVLASLLVVGLLGCTDGASGCSGATPAPTTSTTTNERPEEEDQGTSVSVKIDEEGGALGVKTEEGDEVDIEVGDAK